VATAGSAASQLVCGASCGLVGLGESKQPGHIESLSQPSFPRSDTTRSGRKSKKSTAAPQTFESESNRTVQQASARSSSFEVGDARM
jgi:hypothetical protein